MSNIVSDQFPASWSSIVEMPAAIWPSDTSRLEQEADDLAAIVDLVERVATAPDLATAAHTAAGQLQQYLECERVAFGLVAQSKTSVMTTDAVRAPQNSTLDEASGRRAKTGRCRLIVLSGMADFDAAAPLTKAIERSFDEALQHDTILVWPPQDDAERHRLPAHCQLAEAADIPTIVSVPFSRNGNNIRGVCTLFFAGNQTFTDRKRRFIEACAAPLAAVVGAVQRGQQRPWLRATKQFFGGKTRSRGRLLLTLLVIAAVALMLPIPYRVSCDCQIQPVLRRVVAAPFAGTLDRSLVKPGDLVQRNQVLGRMDGREVRWELAGLTADQNRAAKSRDVSMAENKVAAAQIDGLEMQRLAIKRQLWADRAEHLEIKSEIDGVVISGDLKRAEGTPVAIGQSLYEIAPLERMVAEIAIPDEDIAHAQPGQSVVITLDAYPGTTWTGQIATIQPRSETRDNDNVFIAEVNLDNHDQTLRPGMKGRAKIETASHALGWIALHKPWGRLMAWFGW